jgi:hypothetical protein
MKLFVLMFTAFLLQVCSPGARIREAAGTLRLRCLLSVFTMFYFCLQPAKRILSVSSTKDYIYMN